MHHPDFREEFYVATDASNTGVGAVIYQIIAGKTRFIEFPARSLSKSARKYSATKRELYGVVFVLKAFHYYLFGRHFTLFTEHRAFCYLFSQTNESPMFRCTSSTQVYNCPSTCVLPDVFILLLHGIRKILGKTFSTFNLQIRPRTIGN